MDRKNDILLQNPTAFNQTFNQDSYKIKQNKSPYTEISAIKSNHKIDLCQIDDKLILVRQEVPAGARKFIVDISNLLRIRIRT